MLFTAVVLRVELGNLPRPFVNLLMALGVKEGGTWVVWSRASLADILVPQVLILVALIWPFFFVIFSVYDGRRNETLKAELLNVFLAICVSMMTLAGAWYLTYRESSRVAFLVLFVLDNALLLGVRVLWSVYRRSSDGQQRVQRRAVIVVGAGPVGQHVVEQLRKYAWADIDLIGYIDDAPDKQGQMFEGIPVLGPSDQVSAIIKANQVQEAVVALPLHAHERLVEICRTLQGLSVHVHVIPDLFSLSFPDATLDGFGGIPVIHLGQPGIYGWRRLFKRAFDVMAVTLGLVVISPFLLVIAILIKLDSPGPVLYRQKRIGEHGHPFTMLKFRSMQADADSRVHQAYVARLLEQNRGLDPAKAGGPSSLKMEDDPRVTRVGKLIRKTSLDELPQLFNVLRGEMSLVGPRPPIPYEVELYKDWHKPRFEAIPGMTGLWQVRGRNRVSFDEMVRMDLDYIEHQSLWLDIKILAQTPLAVFTGRGAG